GTLHTRGKYCNISIYAPTEDKKEEEKDLFYGRLAKAIDACPRTTLKTGSWNVYSYSSAGALKQIDDALATLSVDILKPAIIDFKAINDRLCTLHTRGKYCNIGLINVYASTEDKEEAEKDLFYGRFLKAVLRIPGMSSKSSWGTSLQKSIGSKNTTNTLAVTVCMTT
uniref:Uncharacterized protein n=1 Tax=Anopheles quadriannulatus TaxID=34691 RepID=A0A182X2I5_ANOQN